MEFDPITGYTIEEMRSIDGSRIIKTIDSAGNVHISRYPHHFYSSPFTDTISHTLSAPLNEKDWIKLIEKLEGVKEVDIPKMNTSIKKEPEYNGRRYRVTCNNSRDLLQDRILKNLSIMKSKLMMECAPVHVRRIECKMTPAVKKNIIQAFKKLNMYGKKTPFIARFDEYGRRLEDDVKIETLEGMTINIVDPNDYGELYLEFTGVVEDLFYKPYIENPYKF